ncbi:hypothetical protein HN011_009103 [Eciton burchellii]|nr:hypothetical protein HN011_009103 [Eciton burchellii]
MGYETLEQHSDTLVSDCITNIESDTIIHNKTQIDKKSSLTREFLRSLCYNKPCFKAMLTPANRFHWAKRVLNKIL